MDIKEEIPGINIIRNDYEKLIKKKACYELHAHVNFSEDLCPPIWDDRLCWGPIKVGTNASQPCPVFQGLTTIGKALNPDLLAFKECFLNGQWNNITNYDICIRDMDELYVPSSRLYVIAYIVITCSVFSMVALATSFFIFCYFKSLYCSRLKVHRNMCVALMLYLLSLFPVALDIFSMKFLTVDWFCKFLLVLQMFSGASCCAWMFLEGLLLHSRVTVNIFKKDAPFKLYYAIGWGLPSILTIAWTCVTSQVSAKACWTDYSKSYFLWIITGPQLLALSANAVFLVNIIRVLLTKHQATNTTEVIQVKKAIKATALLFPLLGIPHLIACFASGTDSDVYWIFTAIFWSTQGLAFGILYCFINADVQTAFRNVYQRSTAQRDCNRSRFKVSRGTSQTSNTYLSSESGITRNKINSDVAINLNDPSGQKKDTIMRYEKGTTQKQDSLTML